MMSTTEQPPDLVALSDAGFITVVRQLMRQQNLSPTELALMLGLALGRLHNALEARGATVERLEAALRFVQGAEGLGEAKAMANVALAVGRAQRGRTGDDSP